MLKSVFIFLVSLIGVPLYAVCVVGLSFSWKRAVGITKMKRDFSKATGIPTSRAGLERKIGKAIIYSIIGKKK